LYYLISLVVNILTVLVILHVLLSYFLAPYHPLREVVDRIVDPLLAPIRRYVAPVGGLDLSSLILVLLMQLIGSLLANLLGRF
jgi:YggT family protein